MAFTIQKRHGKKFAVVCCSCAKGEHFAEIFINNLTNAPGVADGEIVCSPEGRTWRILSDDIKAIVGRDGITI